jgi:acylphosphatase
MEWNQGVGGSLVMTGSNSDMHGDYARAKLLVSGRVQGVGFRSFAGRYANALKLNGWVKNLYDGRVEVVAEGDKKRILHYIRLLEEGTPWSRVDNVSVEWQQYKGDLTLFIIR